MAFKWLELGPYLGIDMFRHVPTLWVCLKIVYLIFQWIITMFPLKLLFVGIPYFQTNPYKRTFLLVKG